ncbi:MAG: cysteine desulfurase family protein, partial [Myxococcota bacterium]
DHHATTPLDPRVLEAMQPYLTEEFGNASSATHAYGWRAEAAVEDARERLARAIGASDPSEIVFTSGTTESDNLALQGVMRGARRGRDHLIVSAVEHPAVLDTADALAREGFRVTRLPVDGEGRVDPDALARAIGPETALVSVMAANSEIGTREPLDALAAVCREHEVPFHSDAAQAVGKLPVDVVRSGVDLLAFCAHKLYGPKGVGALYVRGGRPRIRIQPLLHGGGHERGLRSGTLPVPLVVGFARAVELCLEGLAEETERVGALRDRLWERLGKDLPDLRLNGPPPGAERLAGNLNVSFLGTQADALLLRLRDVALSTGSACASARGEPSHVLGAIGLTPAEARSAVRFGLGRGTTREEIDRTAERLAEEVVRARRARAGSALP